ncbi:hypothetical protein HYU14_01030 [Candidatus Woesearchaeota archaeon]|nr:hypothetical protein [Candidatus Woesearchaeota archaeon]
MAEEGVTITYAEMLQLIVLAFLLITVVLGVRSCFSDISAQDERNHNTLSILAAYLSNLRAEDGQQSIPLKFDSDYSIVTLRKCAEGDKPGTGCSSRPLVCLRDNKNPNKAKFCEEIAPGPGEQLELVERDWGDVTNLIVIKQTPDPKNEKNKRIDIVKDASAISKIAQTNTAQTNTAQNALPAQTAQAATATTTATNAAASAAQTTKSPVPPAQKAQKKQKIANQMGIPANPCQQELASPPGNMQEQLSPPEDPNGGSAGSSLTAADSFSSGTSDDGLDGGSAETPDSSGTTQSEIQFNELDIPLFRSCPMPKAEAGCGESQKKCLIPSSTEFACCSEDEFCELGKCLSEDEFYNGCPPNFYGDRFFRCAEDGSQKCCPMTHRCQSNECMPNTACDLLGGRCISNYKFDPYYPEKTESCAWDANTVAGSLCTGSYNALCCLPREQSCRMPEKGSSKTAYQSIADTAQKELRGGLADMWIAQIKIITPFDYDDKNIYTYEEFEEESKALSTSLLLDFSCLTDIKIAARNREDWILEEKILNPTKEAEAALSRLAEKSREGKPEDASSDAIFGLLPMMKNARDNAQIKTLGDLRLFLNSMALLLSGSDTQLYTKINSAHEDYLKAMKKELEE